MFYNQINDKFDTIVVEKIISNIAILVIKEQECFS